MFLSTSLYAHHKYDVMSSELPAPHFKGALSLQNRGLYITNRAVTTLSASAT